jgi:4-amino-4-deoxy-L-arabinose transferase-like glycosyltransferase
MAGAAASTAATTISFSERLARRPLLIVAVVALIAWLPGFLMLPPLDRDESRFAEASHQMVETGNYVDIRFANGPRYNKPIGIYWLQSATAALSGPALRDRIWVYRLPSLIGGFVALLLLYLLARSVAPPRAALVSGVLLGSTLLMVAESDIATTDAALLATVIAAQGVLMRVYLARREQRAPPSLLILLGGWAAVGGGILLKGPVILGVLGATTFSLSFWDRDAKWLAGTKPILGAAIVAALVSPWAIAIGIASHGAFYQQAIGHDFAAKLVSGEESHGAPPGYYLLLSSITFWPAVLLLLPALALAIGRRREAVFRFLLAWGGATWLMFELVPTKLPHYVLPAYPALALLCGLWAAHRSEVRLNQRVLHIIACIQFFIGALALAATCIYLPERFGGVVRWPVVGGVAPALAVACLATILLLRGRSVAALATGVTCAVVFYLVLGLGVIPQLHELWLSPRAAQLIAANRRSNDPPVVLAGYVEPSLVFQLAGNVEIQSGAAAAQSAATKGGLALVELRARARFLAGLADAHASTAQLGALSGLDYSTGRPQRLTLYRVTPAKPE